MENKNHSKRTSQSSGSDGNSDEYSISKNRTTFQENDALNLANSKAVNWEKEGTIKLLAQFQKTPYLKIIQIKRATL